MDSFQDIIRAIGIKRLREALGVTDNHARMMLMRDSIPVEYWSVVLKLLPGESGVTLERLAEMREGRFGSARRRASQEAHA